jgi:hypothetical protein
VAGAEDLDLAGDVVDVRVVRSNKHSLEAELGSEGRAKARPLHEGARRPAPRRALPVIMAGGAE